MTTGVGTGSSPGFAAGLGWLGEAASGDGVHVRPLVTDQGAAQHVVRAGEIEVLGVTARLLQS